MGELLMPFVIELHLVCSIELVYIDCMNSEHGGQTFRFEGSIDWVINNEWPHLLKVDTVLYVILLFFYREMQI